MVQRCSTLNRLLIVILSFCMMYILVGCQELEPSILEQYTGSDILMQPEKPIYPKDTKQINVIISNKTDRDTFLSPFCTDLLLETEKSGQWYSIPAKKHGSVSLRPEAAISIHANDETSAVVRFDEYDYHFKAGNYRAIAEVDVYTLNSPAGENVLVSCEFQLSDSSTMKTD